MFDSIGTQVGLGLAAGCCLISSAMAELGQEGEGAAAVQEKQVGASKKRPSSSQIIGMQAVVIQSHPTDEEVHLAHPLSSHSSLNDHHAQPLGSQSHKTSQMQHSSVLKHMQRVMVDHACLFTQQKGTNTCCNVFHKQDPNEFSHTHTIVALDN